MPSISETLGALIQGIKNDYSRGLTIEEDVNLGHLSKGMYILRLDGNNYSEMKKIVIEN